jgi:tetratricopeptide (TPR) repeat protein
LGLIQWLGCNLGWLFHTKLKQLAIQDYNQAIELNPKDARVFNNRGLAYADLKQFEKAIQDYNQEKHRHILGLIQWLGCNSGWLFQIVLI